MRALALAACGLLLACGGAAEPDDEDYVVTPVEMEDGTTCYVLQTSRGAPRGITCMTS